MDFFSFCHESWLHFPLGYSIQWNLLAELNVIRPLCVSFQIRTAKPHDAKDS